MPQPPVSAGALLSRSQSLLRAPPMTSKGTPAPISPFAFSTRKAC